jgi:hypothetical protein
VTCNSRAMKIFLTIMRRTTTEIPFRELPEIWFPVEYRLPLLFLPPEVTNQIPQYVTGRHPVILDSELFKKLRQKIGIRVITDQAATIRSLLDLEADDPSVLPI